MEAPSTVRRLTLSPRRARIAAILVTLMAVAVGVGLLVPAMASPLAADDRYFYLTTPIRADDSYIGVFTYTWRELPYAVSFGRLQPLGTAARRLFALASTQLAIATGTPLVIYNAATKLLLFAGIVLSSLWLVRSLRVRAADGRIVRASRTVLWLTGVIATVMLAAGVQTQGQFRNGWTAYPVYSYGCMVAVVSLVAITLVLTDAVARSPSRWRRTWVAGIMLLLAAALTASYELTYPAVPVAAVALLLQAVGPKEERRAAVLAKLTTGVPFFGGFLVGVVALRVYVAGICAERDCYAGVQPALGLGVLRTTAYNLLSAPPMWPGLYRRNLEEAGMVDRWPVGYSGASIVLAVLAAATILAARWLAWPALRRTGRGRGDAQVALLVRAGVLFALVGLLAAVMMAISVQAQDAIRGPGIPYRNTVMTWAGVSFAVASVTVALGLVRVRRAGPLAWLTATVVALMAATLAVEALPRNLLAVQAVRALPRIAVMETMQWETTRGDISVEGERRRCEAIAALERVKPDNWIAMHVSADELFRRQNGMPFCTTSPPGGQAARVAGGAAGGGRPKS